MDAVVLAAGRNDRLRGYVPAYLKPLLLINGEPLIVSLCRNALNMAGQVVVVVAPQNAAQIADVLSARFSVKRFSLVVQMSADGPARALQQGMRLVHDPEVLVLCGDNDVPHDDMRRAAEILRMAPEYIDVVLCCTKLPREQAARFSRLSRAQRVLREGDFHTEEAGNEFLCWCGPVAARSDSIRAALSQMGEDARLSTLFNDCRGLDGFVGNSRDLGVPEALT